jgi:hypothetical protein
VVENRHKVQAALKNREIDTAVITKWPFAGDFLKFIKDKGIFYTLKWAKGSQKRKMLRNDVYILLYILKLIIGIPRIRGSSALLGDAGVMSFLGFDMDSVMNGLCNRGDANQHGSGYKKNHLGSWMSLH